MTMTPSRSWLALGWAALLAAGLAATPALAQDSDAATGGDDETTTTTGTDDAPAADEGSREATAPDGTPADEILSTGQAVGQGPEIYVREEHGDWEIRCLRAPEGQTDPCQMFQRLSDQNGNPTADVNVFDLPDGGEIRAGATILTPLQTLLTAQLTMSIDGGQPRRYPYSFCDPSGCYARLGFTADDITRLRRGAKAELIVVPALAPDQQARLTMSLTGFTAGYEAVTVANPN